MTPTLKQLRRKLHQCVECGKPAGVQTRCPEHQQRWRLYHWRRGKRLRRAARHEAARQAREAQWKPLGTNLIACCGTLHPILVLLGQPQTLITACCRRVLGMIPAPEEAPCEDS